MTTGGRAAFEAYAQSTGGKTYDQRPIPVWDDLGPEIQAAWNRAYEASVTWSHPAVDASDPLVKTYLERPASGPSMESFQELAYHLASSITDSLPPSRERSTALTNIQQGLMWAREAVELHGVDHGAT